MMNLMEVATATAVIDAAEILMNAEEETAMKTDVVVMTTKMIRVETDGRTIVMMIVEMIDVVLANLEMEEEVILIHMIQETIQITAAVHVGATIRNLAETDVHLPNILVDVHIP